MKAIHLSDSVYERLLRQVTSFDDTPEVVISRLLEIAGNATGEAPPTPPRRNQRNRAAPGSILPEKEYWPPLLAILVSHGGRAPANDVIEEVGRRLADRLLPGDHDELDIGEVRWRNRVRFARLRLKERGLLRDDSPRGVWEISDAGREFLDRL